MIVFNQLLNRHFLFFYKRVLFIKFDIYIGLKLFDSFERWVWLIIISRFASLFIHLEFFLLSLFIVFFLFDISVVVIICFLFGVCAAWSMDATKLALLAIELVVAKVCVLNYLGWLLCAIDFLRLWPRSNINPGLLEITRHLRHFIDLILICRSKARQLVLFLRRQQKLLLISSLSFLVSSVMDSLIWLKKILIRWDVVFRLLLISKVVYLR